MCSLQQCLHYICVNKTLKKTNKHNHHVKHSKVIWLVLIFAVNQSHRLKLCENIGVQLFLYCSIQIIFIIVSCLLWSPQQTLPFKSTCITAELALLFSQSDSEEEFEGFREEGEKEKDEGLGSQSPKATVGALRCCVHGFICSGFVETLWHLQEEDNDFYSDGEEEDEEEARRPRKKRRSLLVALRCVGMQQKALCRSGSYLACEPFNWSCNRFPVRRISASKQEPQKAQRRWPPGETLSQRLKGRLKKGKQPKEVKEEIVSKSLQKRDENIKENKAMVSRQALKSYA